MKRDKKTWKRVKKTDEKRKKIGKETLEIFASIALTLGIDSLNKELEDLAFQTVYPLRLHTLQKMIQKSRGNRKEIMEKVKGINRAKVKKWGFNY